MGEIDAVVCFLGSDDSFPIGGWFEAKEVMELGM